jgi:hypothetical protein
MYLYVFHDFLLSNKYQGILLSDMENIATRRYWKSKSKKKKSCPSFWQRNNNGSGITFTFHYAEKCYGPF